MTTPDLNEGKGLIPSSSQSTVRITPAGVVRATLIAASIAAASVAAPATLAPVHAYAATSDVVQSLDALDAAIRAHGNAQQLSAAASAGTLSPEVERLILQRELVRRAGFDGLSEYCARTDAHEEFFTWLTGDLKALRYYITGGAVWAKNGKVPGSSDYIASLDILRRLREENAADLERADADVHLRMMVAASLDVSGRSRLWTGDPGFVSDPLVRYRTLRVFRDDSRYRFKRDLFDALPVETMRYVFENQITDAELPWLANYSLHRFSADDAKTEDSRLNAYSYIWYTGDYASNNGYSNAAFYDDALFSGPVTEMKSSDGPGKPLRTWQGGWKEKYRLEYDDANFPNALGQQFHIGCGETSKVPGATQDKTKYHRLWMVFEKGGVCGALAKTFANLNGMVGVPSFVVGQPGHAATLTYELRVDSSGKAVPTYRIQNDVSGWGRSKAPSAAHRQCGWGTSSTSSDSGNYILYSQDALSDWEGYVSSYETRLLAASFEGAADRAAIADASRGAQRINFDAIRMQIDLMAKGDADAVDWERFAQGVAEDLAYYPLAMHDLVKEMEKHAGEEAKIRLEAVRLAALQRSSTVNSSQTVHADACVRVAKQLMGEKDGSVATFSFDGDDALKIKLGEHLRGGGVPWKFSLDGGKTWTELTDGSYEYQLTEAQGESITAENNIMIQLIGVNTVNCIDILEGSKTTLKCEPNDRANRIYFFDGQVPKSGYQMKVDDGQWEPLDVSRTFEGDRVVKIRTVPSGVTMGRELCEFAFTADEGEADLVPYEEMHVNSYSSSRDGAAMANRVIDGYYGPGNEFWTTGKEPTADAWIVIDLGRERSISSIDYWRPKNLNTNGIPRWGKMTVTVSAAPDGGLPAGTAPDPGSFVEVGRYGKNGASMEGWKEANLSCTLQFPNGPAKARYFKIHLTDIYFCATLFDFWEVHEPGLEASSIAFDRVEVGYGAIDAKAVELSNSGKGKATIESVELDSDDAFEIVERGAQSVEAGDVDRSWKIAPKTGLPAGSYRTTLRVTYHGSNDSSRRELEIPVEIEVAAQPVTVQVGFEKVDGSSVRLRATVSGAEGVDYRVQYALCEKNEAPSDALAAEAGDEVQGNPLNAWTDDPLFSGLVPGGTYYAFARVLGVPGVDQGASMGGAQIEVEDSDGGDSDGDEGNGSGGSGSEGDSDNGAGNGSGDGNGSGNSGGNGDGSGSGDGSGDGDGGNGSGDGSGDGNGSGSDGGDSSGGGSGSGSGSGDGGSNGGGGGNGSDDGSGEGSGGDAGNDDNAPDAGVPDAPEDGDDGQEVPDSGAGDGQEEDQEESVGGNLPGDSSEGEGAGSDAYPESGSEQTVLPTTGDAAPASLLALLTAGASSIVAGAALRLRRRDGASRS